MTDKRRRDIDIFAEQCESTEEYRQRREIIGYLQNPCIFGEAQDHPDQYYVNINAHYINAQGWSSEYYTEYIPKISEELFQYSLYGIKSFNIYDEH
jgi:hypothetical protein